MRISQRLEPTLVVIGVSGFPVVDHLTFSARIAAASQHLAQRVAKFEQQWA